MTLVRRSRSTRRCRPRLPPPRVFIGPRADRRAAGTLISSMSGHMRSHHLHPSHLAGDASIIELFKRVARGRAQDRDDMPTLPRDQRPINELERSLDT